MKILFLYSEVMGYTEAVLRSLIDDFGAKITLVYWDHGHKSDHSLSIDCEQLIPRSTTNYRKLTYLVDQMDPNLIFISGWMDSMYLSISRYAKRKGFPVVAGMDTQWNGSLKQIFSSSILKYYWKRHFDYIWVPGKRQHTYAGKLGFKNKTFFNLYSADVNLFQKAWPVGKNVHYPHQLLFAGRLVSEKGINELINAFRLTKKQKSHDWELIIAGNGPLKSSIPADPDIKFVGFQKPEDLMDLMSKSGAFCLPSFSEPWGVIIHEAASAGLPMILSDSCGAGEVFLEDGKNGFFFKSGDISELNAKLNAFFELTDESLYKMGETSFNLSNKITPLVSAQSLIQVIKNQEIN